MYTMLFFFNAQISISKTESEDEIDVIVQRFPIPPGGNLVCAKHPSLKLMTLKDQPPSCLFSLRQQGHP